MSNPQVIQTVCILHRYVITALFLEINTENQGINIQDNKDTDPLMSDDEETSMLDTLSSEQLARRPSFKYVCHIFQSTIATTVVFKQYRKILDDLSAADQTLQKNPNSDLLPSAAVLQAQQLQAALQQVASTSGLVNTSLLPGLFQGGTSTASNGDQISSQLSVMLPAQQQVSQSVVYNHVASWLGPMEVVQLLKFPVSWEVRVGC